MTPTGPVLNVWALPVETTQHARPEGVTQTEAQTMRADRLAQPELVYTAPSEMTGPARAATPGIAPPRAPAAADPVFRPGAVGTKAEAFALAEGHRVIDLALDFVPPELYAAARTYGFGIADAARAAHLAHLGPATLTTLAMGMDFALVSGAPAVAGTAEAGVAPTRAAGPAPFFMAPMTAPSAPDSARPVAPALTLLSGSHGGAPHGAFFLPRSAAESRRPRAQAEAERAIESAALRRARRPGGGRGRGRQPRHDRCWCADRRGARALRPGSERAARWIQR